MCTLTLSFSFCARLLMMTSRCVPSWQTASIKNDQYVLRAKFSMNTIAMRFATSSFTPVMNTSAAISSYSAVAVSVPRDGCTPFINARSVVDRFVLIEEGGCFFATKVQYATQAGAKGVIITRKTSATPVTMKSRAGLNGTIPAIMVSFTDGNRLRADKDATTVRITRTLDLYLVHYPVLLVHFT